MKDERVFAMIVLLSLIGGFFKILGGIVYGSKCLLVDSATSFANLIVAIAMVSFYKLSLREPDADHTYGHRRLRLASIAVAVSVYSLVLGFVIAYLLFSLSEDYAVEAEAPVLAVIGALFYSLAILAGRRIGGEGEVYARYTFGEIMESGIGVLASFGGAFYSYVIDLSGAILLAGFWGKETVENTWMLVNVIAERVEPKLTTSIHDYLRSRGYNVKSLRFRDVGGKLMGDISIILPGGMSVDRAHEIASLIERELHERFGLEVVVHVEPDFAESLEAKSDSHSS